MTKLTEQKRLFVDEFIKLRCKNQTQAAINAGYSPKTAASQASGLMKQSEVLECLEDRKNGLARELREEFIFDALEARGVMYQILSNPNAKDSDRLSAAKDFLDRAGFKAPDKVEHSGSVEMRQDHLAAILEQLK